MPATSLSAASSSPMPQHVNGCPTVEGFRALLRKHGLKATAQRMAVHEAMMVLVHASPDQVSAQIAAAGTQKVTVASVYNILSQLADFGIYRRRLSGSGKMVFDVRSGNHLHLYDRETGEFRDVVDEDLTDLVESRLRRRRFKGYSIDYVDIQFVCHPTKRKTK